jgi:hypothetical protein
MYVVPTQKTKNFSTTVQNFKSVWETFPAINFTTTISSLRRPWPHLHPSKLTNPKNVNQTLKKRNKAQLEQTEKKPFIKMEFFAKFTRQKLFWFRSFSTVVPYRKKCRKKNSNGFHFNIEF